MSSEGQFARKVIREADLGFASTLCRVAESALSLIDNVAVSSDLRDTDSPTPQGAPLTAAGETPSRKRGAGKQAKPRANKPARQPRPEPVDEQELRSESVDLTEEDVENLAPEVVPVEQVGESAANAIVKTVARGSERGLVRHDSLQRYMREVSRHPLLSREEEHALAVRLRESGDVDAAYRLVTSNLRLVVKLAHEYHRTSFSLLDLIQEGNVGLMHAVRKFDPYRGVKLSSYAAWWIRAYILRYIMENFRIVKLGTTQAQRKLFFNLRKERERLAAQGFDPTAKLLAERLDVTEQDVSEMEQRLSQDEFSLDVPVGEDNRATRADRLSSMTAPADERLADHQLTVILKAKLTEFGATLKDKERYIFEKRLVAEEPMTLQQIGDHYGLTRERARQIEAKLVREFKAWIQEAVPDFKHLEIGGRDD